jgi:hypothetical protein
MKTLLAAAAVAVTAGVLMTAAPVYAQSPAACEARAKQSIDWVVYRNVHYRHTLDNAIRRGASPYDALLFAERNNPVGRAALQACADWTRNYLGALGFRAAVN